MTEDFICHGCRKEFKKNFKYKMTMPTGEKSFCRKCYLIIDAKITKLITSWCVDKKE